MLSPGKLCLEVTLDREVYFHGDKIAAHVTVSNYCKKSVRSVKVSVVQHTEVTLVNGHYAKSVASIESREGCPIAPGCTFTKCYQLTPIAAQNRDKRGDNDANHELTYYSDFFRFVSRNCVRWHVARVRHKSGVEHASDRRGTWHHRLIRDAGEFMTVRDSD